MPAVDEVVEIPRDLWAAVVELCLWEMPRYYRGGQHAVVEWRLRGDASGRWQLVLTEDACEVVPDGTHAADVSFEASDRDFVSVCLGQADPRRLALRGRIRPRGNLLLAARVPRWFDTPA